jgi:hypothetical protein
MSAEVSLLGSQATLSPNDRQSGDADMPKPRRSRALALTRVDRRLPLGRRIAALKAIYFEALGGAEGLSPMKRLRVEEAAEAKALAELARGRYLRDGHGDLPDLIATERRADAAMKAVGLPKERQKPQESVADILKRVNGASST